MATPPPEVRRGLERVTGAATAQVVAASADATTGTLLERLIGAVRLAVPTFFDTSGALAVAWYDEIREESNPTTVYDPIVISEPNTDWIELELKQLETDILKQVNAEVEAVTTRIVAEAEALTQKEVARGFRGTINGNARRDPDAIGWSRHTRPGACKFCLMLARNSVVYRSERAARFSAHTTCHCIARPEFENGEHGPEADVLQYVAATRERTEEERKALREYLNRKYPDAPG